MFNAFRCVFHRLCLFSEALGVGQVAGTGLLGERPSSKGWGPILVGHLALPKPFCMKIDHFEHHEHPLVLYGLPCISQGITGFCSTYYMFN